MSRYHMDEEELDSRLPLLGDPEGRGGRDDGRGLGGSPAMSTVSTQSHEVKHIFEPCPSLIDREADAGADYSHIHIKPKPRHGDGGFPVRPPPPAYHRPEGNPPTHFHHPFPSGLVSGNIQRFRAPPQTLSLEDVSNYELSRRKSWSPPLLRQNTAAYHSGQKNTRSCYSSNMVDWEAGPQGHAGINPPVYSQGHSYGYWQGHLQAHPQGRPQGHVQGHLESVGGTGRSNAGESLPPRLAPVSGVPPEKLSRNLIRPIAFKPAYARPPQQKMCPQCGEDTSCCACSGYSPLQYSLRHGSQASADPLSPRSPSVRSVDQSSVHSAGHSSHRSAGYGSEPVHLTDDSPGVNVDYSPPRKASAAGSEVGGQTPSPSDSGVGELEAMLKEKEAEIMTLRQVMDCNERAIFQVYEEKRSQWLADMQQIREDYESKLKAQQLKATQLEQALTLQVQRLQQEKSHLQEKTHPQQEKHLTQQEKPPAQQDKAHDKAPMQQDKAQAHGNYANLQKDSVVAARPQDEDQASETNTSVSRTSSSSTPQNPPSSSQSSPGGVGMSVQEEMALKTTEVLALRAQLQTLQGQLEEKDQQIADTLTQVEVKSQELKAVHEQLDQLSGVDGVSICEESTQTVMTSVDDEKGAAPCLAVMSEEEYMQSLERQVDSLRQQLQTAEALVESERVQWLEEKNKVIRYQKQLQLNYVQMQQKNKALEAEVEQLTLELESRHLKLAAMNGEESVC
ncbi:uncharacterized protein LOC143275627 [Babylonia areolata]|uniref:uncharacterized protein LOC143275627 n=1 Tax=Babylonia areolata TaxID=304850 RepID=UPI003FCF99CB